MRKIAKQNTELRNIYSSTCRVACRSGIVQNHMLLPVVSPTYESRPPQEVAAHRSHDQRYQTSNAI
jgi:hypothetical protein